MNLNGISQYSVNAGYSGYWISARRPPDGGRYEFYFQPSGLSVVQGRWYGSQPYRGTDGDDCVADIESFNWQWDDCDCSLNYMFMCKIEV